MRRQGVGSILFKRLIVGSALEGLSHGCASPPARSNEAMRALASKFGAHLVFRHGESTGTIDLARQPQAELAKLAIDAPLDAARAVMNFNRAWWKLFAKMYGAGARHDARCQRDAAAR